MKQIKMFCDICQKEIDERGWGNENEAHPFEIKNWAAMGNLGRIKGHRGEDNSPNCSHFLFKDVCSGCQEFLSDGIYDLLVSRGAIAE